MSLLVRALPLVETHHHLRALPLVSLLVRALPLVETINKHVRPPLYDRAMPLLFFIINLTHQGAYVAAFHY